MSLTDTPVLKLIKEYESDYGSDDKTEAHMDLIEDLYNELSNLQQSYNSLSKGNEI